MSTLKCMILGTDRVEDGDDNIYIRNLGAGLASIKRLEWKGAPLSLSPLDLVWIGWGSRLALAVILDTMLESSALTRDESIAGSHRTLSRRWMTHSCTRTSTAGIEAYEEHWTPVSS